VKDAKDLKKGDRLIITDTSTFKIDCQWLQGQEVEVVKVTQLDCLGGYIQTKHPKEPVLFLRPSHVERA
jgi:hypothetical protein